jgi:NAD(P)-dependent dehydrogenase (short-subunit alcohol dehydrogenase family)
MKLDHLLRTHRQTSAAGIGREFARQLPARAGSIVFVVRRRERVLRSERAFFVMSTEAETSLTLSLVNGASLRLLALL